MRVFFVALLLAAACRTQPFDPNADLSLIEHASPSDLATEAPVVDFSIGDLARPTSDAGLCSRDNPTGWCPQGDTCCAFDCWGGSDEKGWCVVGEGCPAC
jgi:hypothetical protein